MTKHPQSSPDDVSFDDAVRVVRRWLMSLISAIGTTDYFDAWLAAVQLRVALDRAERLAEVGLMSSESRLFVSRRLDDIRSIAAPMLALAPTLSRHEVRHMRTSDAHRDRRTQEHMEQQWVRSVQQQLNAGIYKDDDNGAPGESRGSHDDHVSDQVQCSNYRTRRLVNIGVFAHRAHHLRG